MGKKRLFDYMVRDLKPVKGARKLFRGSMPMNLPARYVRTKGFVGLSLRDGKSWSGLAYALDGMHDAVHERLYGERPRH